MEPFKMTKVEYINMEDVLLSLYAPLSVEYYRARGTIHDYVYSDAEVIIDHLGRMLAWIGVDEKKFYEDHPDVKANTLVYTGF